MNIFLYEDLQLSFLGSSTIETIATETTTIIEQFSQVNIYFSKSVFNRLNIRIHFHNLTSTLQDQLRSKSLSHLVGSIFVIPKHRSKMSGSISRSNLLERSNNIQSTYQTNLLHSSETEVLMQTIKNLETANSVPMLNDLFPVKQQQQH